MRYQFVVEGRVSEIAQSALPELRAATAPGGGTALSGWLEDQSAVLTMLVRICDLALNVVEMRRLSE